MASPALNEKTFAPEKVDKLWADTGGGAAGYAAGTGLASGGAAVPRAAVMSLDGTIAKSFFLLAFLIAGATFGWNQVSVTATQVRIPGWIWIVMFVALGLALVTIFRPQSARLTGMGYALAEGVVVGAISKVYNEQWKGIALQAVICTIAVFAVMLGLYTSRAIRVTPRVRQVVIGATLGIFVAYLVMMVIGLFTGSMGLITDAGPMGIIFSVIIVGVAAFNPLLDFDMVEKGVAAQAPKYMEWYCGFGILVTVVWLYLEMLRLLGKLRS